MELTIEVFKTMQYAQNVYTQMLEERAALSRLVKLDPASPSENELYKLWDATVADEIEGLAEELQKSQVMLEGFQKELPGIDLIYYLDQTTPPTTYHIENYTVTPRKVENGGYIYEVQHIESDRAETYNTKQEVIDVLNAEYEGLDAGTLLTYMP